MTIKNSQNRWVALLISALILFCLIGGNFLSALPESPENKLNKDFFIRFGRDFKGVVSAPLDWNKQDFLRLAVFSGAGLLIYSLDQHVYDWVQENRSPSSEDASSVFSHFGNGGVLLGLAGVIYAVGEVNHQDSLRKTALLSVESLATASVLAWALKAITGRARPFAGESSHSFHPFSFKSSYWSLPSGHAAGAFAVATTIAEQSDSLAIDITAYSLATLAGLSRIHDNKHWTSDVFIGSVIGYFVGKKISDLNRRGVAKPISLSFQLSGGRQALTLSVAF
jgi:membrane-associated phospholipid phosphatase